MNEKYIDYPFTSNGINFISRIYSHSEFAEKVKNLPLEMWQKLNSSAIENILGDVSKMSMAQIMNGLEKINDGGSHAFILLGANN